MSKPRIVRYRDQYCLYWRVGGKVRRRLLKDELGEPVTNRENAERVALDVQRSAIKPLGNLIGDLADKYFIDKKGRIVSYENMEFAWKAIQPFVAHLRPEHITREWCIEYTAAQRAKGRADGTIRKQYTVLSAICHWSDKHSPILIELPPMPAPRDRYLTKDEARRLIAAATGKPYEPHIRLFIVLALCTGARASALLEMKWNQIDFARGRIDLGKSVGNKGRAQPPMNNTARTALVAAFESRMTDYVIEYAGGPVKSIKKGFANACRRAGFDDVHPHVLRHTAAVWMVDAGRPMAEVAQYLGHSSEAVTFSTYARYSPNHLRGAADALELDMGIQEVGKRPFLRSV